MTAFVFYAEMDRGVPLNEARLFCCENINSIEIGYNVEWTYCMISDFG